VLPVGPRDHEVLALWQEAEGLTAPDDRARAFFAIVPLLRPHRSGLDLTTATQETLMLIGGMRDPEIRIRALAALLPYLPTPTRRALLHDTLSTIDNVPGDVARVNALNILAEHLDVDSEARLRHIVGTISAPSERARICTTLARVGPEPLRPRFAAAALSAVQQMDDETLRTRALSELALHLDRLIEVPVYPELRDHALTLASSIRRRDLRAAALVALAQHLSHDLQGEALAAVHTLAEERDRATLLARLVPYLPPDMLVASLAVAHSLSAQDARVDALAALAHHVPLHARDQTMRDALAAATNLPGAYERVSALIALFDILPDHLREQAQTTALETARLIENENARARALGQLAAHLPLPLLQRAFEAAQLLESSAHRQSALTAFIAYLPDDVRETAGKLLLRAIAGLPVEYRRARALAAVIPAMPVALLPDMLALARTISDPFDRTTSYVGLARRLPPAQRPALVSEVWPQIAQIESGYDAACALASIAPMLPATAAPDLAAQARTILSVIDDEYDQASAVAVLAPLLVAPITPDPPDNLPDQATVLAAGLAAALRVPHDDTRCALLAQGAALAASLSDDRAAYRLWAGLLEAMIDTPPDAIARNLGALAPLIGRVGGDTGLRNIAQRLKMRYTNGR
jgi:hypothetical protein